jgi:hypothetical protein
MQGERIQGGERDGARSTLQIAPAQVGLIYKEMQLLREVKLEAEQVTDGHLAAGAGSEAAVARYRHQRLAVDDVLRQVEWDDRRDDEPVELTGPRWLMRDVVYGAVLWAGDRVAAECHRDLDGEFDVDAVAARQRDLAALLELMPK